MAIEMHAHLPAVLYGNGLFGTGRRRRAERVILARRRKLCARPLVSRGVCSGGVFWQRSIAGFGGLRSPGVVLDRLTLPHAQDVHRVAAGRAGPVPADGAAARAGGRGGGRAGLHGRAVRAGRRRLGIWPQLEAAGSLRGRREGVCVRGPSELSRSRFPPGGRLPSAGWPGWCPADAGRPARAGRAARGTATTTEPGRRRPPRGTGR